MKLLLENWRKYLNESVEEMLHMSLDEFDQTSQGWRRFADPTQQVEIMTRYLETNPTAKQDQVFMWHLGQALAFAGQIPQAIDQMKTVNTAEPNQYNKLYQLFTISFLGNDMNKFNALYNQYKNKIEGDTKDTNIQIVKCMKQCGDKGNFNYKSAYTTRCVC